MHITIVYLMFMVMILYQYFKNTNLSMINSSGINDAKRMENDTYSRRDGASC